MENITLGQIASALAFIVGIIGSVIYLKNVLSKTIDKTFEEKLKPITKDINHLKQQHEEDFMSGLKTDLINLMDSIEKENATAEQKIRAHELFDKYSNKGGNSYVHDKWEKLKKEGKM